jgi:hypothetical protein
MWPNQAHERFNGLYKKKYKLKKNNKTKPGAIETTSAFS